MNLFLTNRWISRPVIGTICYATLLGLFVKIVVNIVLECIRFNIHHVCVWKYSHCSGIVQFDWPILNFGSTPLFYLFSDSFRPVSVSLSVDSVLFVEFPLCHAWTGAMSVESEILQFYFSILYQSHFIKKYFQVLIKENKNSRQVTIVRLEDLNV